jgi:hypothetical protein
MALGALQVHLYIERLAPFSSSNQIIFVEGDAIILKASFGVFELGKLLTIASHPIIDSIEHSHHA